MFGIGFSELVLIGLILIIFIKPEDLPKFFRTLGKLYGQLKKSYDDVVSVKDKILKEIDSAVTLEEKEKAAGNKGSAADSPGSVPLLQKAGPAKLEAPRDVSQDVSQGTGPDKEPPPIPQAPEQTPPGKS
jgi:sec-independent protein translocase protein TatB